MILLLIMAMAHVLKKGSKDRTCFRQNNKKRKNIPPRQNTNYICRILVKIESAFFLIIKITKMILFTIHKYSQRSVDTPQ